MPSLAIGATRFGLTDEGEGVPVVFLHAGVCDRRMWAEQVTTVRDAGYRAVAYDRRGFGETESEDVPFSHTEDLEQVLDHLGIRAAVLVGCSQGGRIAIDFALQHSDRVAALVLVSTALSGDAAPDIYPPEIDPLISAYEAAEEMGDKEMLNRVEAHAWLDGPATPGGRVQGALRALFLEMNGTALAKPDLTQEEEPPSAVDRLESLAQPTLLLTGELDFPHVLERHDRIEAALENSFSAMIEDTAHLPGFERPDLFNQLLLEFLGVLFGGGGE